MLLNEKSYYKRLKNTIKIQKIPIKPKVFSGLRVEYYLALPACDGLLARLAIDCKLWACKAGLHIPKGGFYAKAVLAWNERVRSCDAGGCRAGSGYASEGATAGSSSHVQLDRLLYWRPHRRG